MRRDGFLVSSLVMLAALAGCLDEGTEIVSGAGNVAFGERISHRFTLETVSEVVAEIENVGGVAVDAFLSSGAGCSWGRDREEVSPSHFEGSRATVQGPGVVRAVLPVGTHCFVAGPLDGDGAASFTYSVRVRPSGGGPAGIVQGVFGTLPAPRDPSVAFEGEPWSEPWIAHAVRYYRGLGFFATYGSDPEAVEVVRATIDEEWGLEEIREYAPERPDQILLAVDRERVWNLDLEADVLAGNEMYVGIVNEFAAISRGTVNVTRVEESWESDDGPVLVTAVVNGRITGFEARSIGDWYDLDAVLSAFDQWAGGAGMTYASADTGGQDGFIVVLTAEEKERMVEDRAWTFL